MGSISIDREGFLANIFLARKGPCRAGTTGHIVLSGEQTIDGVAVVAGDRVLVKNQTDNLNAIYTVKTGAWELAQDFDQRGHVTQGTNVLVFSGTTNALTEWIVTTSGRPYPGRQAIAFVAYVSGAAAQPIDADLTAIAALTRTRGDIIRGGAAAWERLALGTLGQVLTSDGTDATWATPRARLTENTTYTVGAGQDFATLQAAWDFVCASVDLAGFDVTLDLADGTHVGLTDDTTTFNGDVRYSGGGRVIINGNAANPENVIVTAGATNWSFHVVNNFLFVQNLEMRSTGDGCLGVALSGVVYFGPGLRFGTTTNEHIHASSGGQIHSAAQAYSIVGSAAKHAFSGQGGQARVLGSAVTLTGTPAFSESFAYVGTDGIFDARAATFTGSATGPAFIAEPGGKILRDTNDLTDLPGNAEGELGPGAIYDEIVGPLADTIASGSFPAAATLVVAIPVWAKRLFIHVEGVSSNTATRHPIILASTDGGSTYPATDYTVFGFSGAAALLIGDALVDMVTDVAAARSWDFDAWVDGIEGGGLTARFQGVTDDFSAGILSAQSFNAALDGRTTHIRFAWRGPPDDSGNFDGGTYSIRATG